MSISKPHGYAQRPLAESVRMVRTPRRKESHHETRLMEQTLIRRPRTSSSGIHPRVDITGREYGSGGGALPQTERRAPRLRATEKKNSRNISRFELSAQQPRASMSWHLPDAPPRYSENDPRALYADSRTRLTSPLVRIRQVRHCGMDGYMPVYSSRGRGYYVQNDAHALISLQNISARFRGDQDGCHGTAAGSNGKITKGRVKTGAAPRANFSRRDLITPFGRLQHYIVDPPPSLPLTMVPAP
ncbi:hypothetical protein BJV77DRAFT_966368 [Russula vinacea]|nr:hypothetical protein BJV77DRAFT_966368 [Russula vinacea]